MTYVTVDAEIDLREIDTQTLQDELKERGADIPLKNPRLIIKSLSDIGVPREILRPLEEWLCQPVPNELKLKAWREFCTK